MEIYGYLWMFMDIYEYLHGLELYLVESIMDHGFKSICADTMHHISCSGNT